MVGLETIFWVYQNSGPALLLFLLLGGGYAWRHDVHPRLQSLEQTQENRGDRWQDQELSARERAMLIDDAHERADELEDVVTRLKKRVRGIENAYAADHGNAPNGHTTVQKSDDGGGA